MPDLWRQSCATHLLGERHRYHTCRFNPSKSTEILPRLRMGGIVKIGGGACVWALQDNALFIIIEAGSAAASCSIRYSTVMKSKITRRAHLKAQFLECAQSAAALMIAVPWITALPAGQGRNVGFQPEIPWPRPDHRHRAGQSAGHFLDG